MAAGAIVALAERARAPVQSFDSHAASLATLGVAAGYRPHADLLRQGERLIGVLPLGGVSSAACASWNGAGTASPIIELAVSRANSTAATN